MKSVPGNVVSPTLWTLTAAGLSPPAIGTAVSGPSGSAAVTSQRVIAGTYQLTEHGTGAAETGFVQVGNWTCAAGGTNYPVNAVAMITLPDLPAGTTVTCTVVEPAGDRLAADRKTVDDPNGGYTGGSRQAFAGTYNCGNGYTGTFTTLTTGDPGHHRGHPGRSQLHRHRDTPTAAAQRVVRLGHAVVLRPAGHDHRPGHGRRDDHQPGGAEVRQLRRSPRPSPDRAATPAASTGSSRSNYNCTLTDGPDHLRRAEPDHGAGRVATDTDPRGSVCTFTET